MLFWEKLLGHLKTKQNLFLISGRSIKKTKASNCWGVTFKSWKPYKLIPTEQSYSLHKVFCFYYDWALLHVDKIYFEKVLSNIAGQVILVEFKDYNSLKDTWMNYFFSQAVGFYLNFVGVLNCTKQNCFWCIVYTYKRERVLRVLCLVSVDSSMQTNRRKSTVVTERKKKCSWTGNTWWTKDGIGPRTT